MAALRLREVPRRRPAAVDAHEVRRRGDGDRAARSSRRSPRRCARASSTRPRRLDDVRLDELLDAPRAPDAGPLRRDARGVPPRRRRRGRPRAHADRPLVPARAARAGRCDPRRRSPASARSSRSTPAPPSSRPARRTTTRAGSAGAAHEVERGDRPSVVILGAGPNRIGQGIEFDYCCVHAAMTVRESGRDAVMINCNPETVSTDYDTSDRLYFEPLTLEDVLGVVEVEQPEGVIVQFGGQTPLKLAAGPGRGRRPAARHERRRDRPRRGPRPLRRAAGPARLRGAAVRRPRARSTRRSRAAEHVGFPLLVRPSYVLGGRAMEIVYSREGLADYLRRDGRGDGREIFLDRFLENAIEVDVDALCDGEDVWIGGIMQHVEEAGIHSGDSACVLPPHSLGGEMLDQIREHDARDRARARRRRPAQRPVRRPRRRPLRDRGQPARVADRAVRLQGDRRAAGQDGLPDHARRADRRPRPARRPDGAAATSASRRRCCRSTASRAPTRCSGPRCARPARSWASRATSRPRSPRRRPRPARRCPTRGTAFITVTDTDKAGASSASPRRCTTSASASSPRAAPREAIARMGIPAQALNKIGEGSPHVVDWIERGDVDLVVNTPTGSGARTDGWEIRRAAVARGHPVPDDALGRRWPPRGRSPRRAAARPPVLSLQELHRAPAAAPSPPRRRREPRPGAAADRRAARAPAAARAERREVGAYVVLVVADPDGPAPDARAVLHARRRRALGRARTSGPYLPRAFSVLRAQRRRRCSSCSRTSGPGPTGSASCGAGDGLWVLGPAGRRVPRRRATGAARCCAAAAWASRRWRSGRTRCWPPRLPAPALLGFRDARPRRGRRAAGQRAGGDRRRLARATTGSSPSCSSAELDADAHAEVYACGPPAMLEAVRALCARARRAAPSSRSSRGWPAASAPASAASCRVREGGYVRVCVDGPVLEAARLGARCRAHCSDGTVAFCGLELAHPVINGSGTFDAIAARRAFGDALARRASRSAPSSPRRSRSSRGPATRRRGCGRRPPG